MKLPVVVTLAYIMMVFTIIVYFSANYEPVAPVQYSNKSVVTGSLADSFDLKTSDSNDDSENQAAIKEKPVYSK